MKSSDAGAPVQDGIERIIADYLKEHPEFFNRHTDLLSELRLPHPCRPAVSLIERQLMLLRQQNTQLRKKFRDLVKIARENDCLSNRMQQLNLVLIESVQLDEMVAGIEAVLREEFSADYTSLGLISFGIPMPSGIGQLGELPPSALTMFAPVFESGRPLCGHFTEPQVALLFGESAPLVGSCALVPLSGVDWKGLVAIGSCDSKRFHPAMGTLFLSRIGELISHAIQPHLQVTVPALPVAP